MSARAALVVGQIVFIDVPNESAHPAVIVLDLGNGAYIVVNGTGSPQDEVATVSLSEAVAKRCGLTKATSFYSSKKFVWYWRAPSHVEAVGSVLVSHLASLRAGAIATLNTMTSASGEVGKIPDGVGLSLSQIKLLSQTLKAVS